MSHSDPSNDEETPLLHPLQPAISRTHSLVHSTHSPRVILLILTSIVFIIGFGGYLVSVPSLRVYEDILCHRYYEHRAQTHVGLNSRIDEVWCKVDEIQEELNILTAGLEILKSVPGMFMAIPYGLLADKIGRKPVFALSIFGILLSLLFEIAVMHAWRIVPIRLVWLAPFIQFLGGGGKTAGATFYAIISDVTMQSERANAFLFAACAGLSAELIAPTVASALMAHSPWISLCSGIAILTSGLCLIAFIPETLHLHLSIFSISNLVPNTASPLSSSSSSVISKTRPKLHRRLTSSLTSRYDSTTPFHTVPILFLLLPFTFPSIGNQSIDLCIRYISLSFSIPLSHASLILSLRALINIILLLILLPLFSTFLLSSPHPLSPRSKDLFLARTSSILLLSGSLLLALSPSLYLTLSAFIIYTLGTGFVPIVRSLISGMADTQRIARLYALVAVVETGSALIGGPIIAALYEFGLEWKGNWQGLPFWGLLGVVGFGAVGIWSVSLGDESDAGCLKKNEERESLLGDTAVI